MCHDLRNGLHFFFRLVNHHTCWFFPVAITNENKKHQYTALRNFILGLQFWFFSLLVFTQYFAVEVAEGVRKQMPQYGNLAFLTVLITITFKYLYDFSTNF